MKNWKTTLTGAVMAAVSFIALYQQSGGDLADWKQYAIPALIAALGYLAKDAGVSGSMKLAVLSCLLLPSCATNAKGEKTFLTLGSSGWTQIFKEAGSAALMAGASQAMRGYNDYRANIGPFTATK